MIRQHLASFTRRPGKPWAPRVVPAAALVLASFVAVAPACATDRLMLAWDDCRSGTGTPGALQDCGALLTHRYLVGAFQTSASIDSVIGAEIVIDLQSAGASLPGFWQLGVGGCNQSALAVVTPTPGGCPDAWGGLGSGMVLDAYPGQPRGLPTQLRMLIVVTVPAIQSRTLEGGVDHEVVRLDVDLDRMGRCPDCATPACLVLNSVRLLRLPGAADVVLVADPASNENQATWQGGAGADCLAVPTTTSSWGRLKVSYR